MPRRCNEISSEKSFDANTNAPTMKEGEILTDLTGKQWKLGKTVGLGGFGEIYLASEDLTRDVKTETPYVAKLERHSSGPLFVEINCYLRIAKEEMIKHWKGKRNLDHLGMPHYVASGSHKIGDEKYRFLIISRYDSDMEVPLQNKKTFNLKTVLSLSYQITDVLEYIHEHGYIHSDIKASNIMLEAIPSNKPPPHTAKISRYSEHVLRKRQPPPVLRVTESKTRKRARNLRQIQVINYNDDLPDFDDFSCFLETGSSSSPKPIRTEKNRTACDRIYLLDYGLASKYLLSNGEHREFCTDERKAHAGTVLFCSRDAHKGVASRRSDMESLGYNMIYWLTGNLPWADSTDDPAVVQRRKTRCMGNIQNFLNYCFNGDVPKCLMEYFKYVEKLQFQDCPNYDFCRTLFKKSIKENGYKNDLKFDLDNMEVKVKKIRNRGRENVQPKNLISIGPPMPPPISNIIFKRPKLRKQTKNKEVDQDSVMNWSKLLIDDPEVIVRAARERKNTDGSDSGGQNILDMDIESMNPTYAMWEIYNKHKESNDLSPKYKGDSSVDLIEGYTPAMMSVYIKKLEREMLELEQIALMNNNNNNNNKRSRVSKRTASKRRITESPPPPKPKRSSRSQTAISNKKVASVKKSKSVPIRKMYRLRG